MHVLKMYVKDVKDALAKLGVTHHSLSPLYYLDDNNQQQQTIQQLLI